MKIGILTQPLIANYGGLIQNYALQQVLIQLGHNPITLDQKNKDIPIWRTSLSLLKGWLLYFMNPKVNRKPRYVLTKQEDEYIRKYSIAFIDKYIKHSRKCVGTEDFVAESKKLNLEGYIVGSDQCWRPCYNMYLKDMFLGFCKELDVKKRVAYAASFGTDEWEFSQEQASECAELVKLFDVISVREKSGINLCKKYLGVDAIHVLDPTLLLRKEEYIALVKDNNVPLSDGKLFHYVLDPSKAITNFINKVSKETGHKIFQILPKYNEDHRTKSDVKYRIEDCVYPSPLSWLRAFMDAEMVIVDSFHGTVFSILFNKPFWVIGNVERGMSRFHSLLSMFGLKERLVTEDKLNSIKYNMPIDWERVNAVLTEKRNWSLELLKKSLE